MQAPPQEDAVAPEAGQKKAVDDRLKKAAARVADLETQVNQAQEKTKAFEQNLAEARRKIQEAQRNAQEASGSDGESEVNYLSPVYYGGYVYGAVPYGRPFIGKKGSRRFHHKGDVHKKGSRRFHYKGDVHKKGSTDYTSSRGRRESPSGAVSNYARTQDDRNFYQSRINPLENNFVNRRQVTGPRTRPHYSK